MFLLDWYKQYLEIKHNSKLNRQEETICNGCETLRQQLSIANHEKQQLLGKLLKEPEVKVEEETPKEVSMPRAMPWRVRQQMLEVEDRKKAQLLKNAPKPSETKPTVGNYTDATVKVYGNESTILGTECGPHSNGPDGVEGPPGIKAVEDLERELKIASSRKG